MYTTYSDREAVQSVSISIRSIKSIEVETKPRSAAL